jgi:sugar phosphate permease
VAAFATFALIGYYAALAPSLLAEDLAIKSPAVAGIVVAEMFLVAAGVVILTRRLRSRTAMLSGLLFLLPSLACLLVAQSFASLSLLMIGTTLGGVASALGYRGTLQVVNGIAPSEQRAEVISSYLIACYLGNSIPVIGIGVLSMLYGHLTAYYVFAATVAVLGAAALFTGWRYTPREE